MHTLTSKQVWVSSKLVITIETGVRGMSESRVYGCLLILCNGLKCQIFLLGYWSFLGGFTFSCTAALSSPSYVFFFYGSIVHLEMSDNVGVGYIGWKHLSSWEQQAQHIHQEEQKTINSVANKEAIERINRT